MTLPFEIPDKHKRKYQCFVCGVMHTDFEEFKKHIIESHDEGREYVVCPMGRCGAPVRDVKMHFKVCHPQTKMPKQGQMKAMVWRDFSSKGSQKGKTRKPKFRSGWHGSTKMKRDFLYRSGYEKTVYECLDMLNDIVAYDVEPFEIPYMYIGKNHKYIPDLIVEFADGHKEVWEIKPATQTMQEKNKAKWNAAEQVCLTRGWKFVIMPEIKINKLKQEVRLQNG